jgi:hypothetical protein
MPLALSLSRLRAFALTLLIASSLVLMAAFAAPVRVLGALVGFLWWLSAARGPYRSWRRISNLRILSRIGISRKVVTSKMQSLTTTCPRFTSHPPLLSGVFHMLVVFHRYTFSLTNASVSMALHACLGGTHAGFHVQFLKDRHYHIWWPLNEWALL